MTKDHADQGQRPADRQEVEHGKTVQPFAAVAETGDDQVRRGADEGGGAAEDGAEGKRHEHLARGQPEPAGELDGDRHEQGQRADIVHEAGQHRSQRHQRADADGRAGFGRQHHPGERVHRTRGLQPAAEHEHAGYRDHGRVPEPGKGLVGRHQPGHHAGEQRTGGHHVVAPPAPEKHGHRGDQDDEDVDLAGGHGWFRGWWSECQNADWAENETVHARLSTALWTAWLGQCPDFLVPVAVRGVVIHHPHGLHEGVADG